MYDQRVGRPTLLDDERAERIIKAIRNGGSRNAAAEAAGVDRSTLFEWIARGRKGEAPFNDFVDRIKRAESVAENAMVRVVRKAARMGTWQAAAWWLERRRSKQYALKRDMKVELKRELSEDEARAKYKELTGKEWGA